MALTVSCWLDVIRVECCCASAGEVTCHVVPYVGLDVIALSVVG